MIRLARLFAIPASLLGMYFIVYALWGAMELPRGEELVSIAKEWFATYGLPIVFACALIEGTLLVGQYFPGGLVIFLGVVSADRDPAAVAQVVATVCIAFSISYSLDYILGRHGWHRMLLKFGLGPSIERSKARLAKQELNAVFLSYWNPNLAAITATAAGVLKLPYARFLAHTIAGVAFWNAFWGVLVSSLGDAALDIMGLKWILAVFSAWVIGIYLKHRWDIRKAAA